MGRDPDREQQQRDQSEGPDEQALGRRAESAEARAAVVGPRSRTVTMYEMMACFSSGEMTVSGKFGMFCGPVSMAS